MRYFVNYRHTDTGLTPTFTYFKKASDLSNQTAPTPIVEVTNGRYYFDHVPTYDEVWELDGGASIPTEEIRYISGSCSPNDDFVTVITTAITAGTTAVNAHTDVEAGIITTAITASTTAINAHTDSNDATLTSTIGTISSNVTSMSALMTRTLGMLHENSFLDNAVFDGNNNLNSARLRLFDTKAHANSAVAAAAISGADAVGGANGLIAYYNIIATYTGVNMLTYRVTREGP